MRTNTISIVGAGLSGSLLAILLARRGFQVEVYERRGDMRAGPVGGGRSINLALSIRGIRALQSVGLDEAILATAVPMYGRMAHALDGALNFQRYGRDDAFYINSVSRGGLNVALLRLAGRYENVRFHFNTRLTGMDFKSAEAHFARENGETFAVTGAPVIGTDGSASALRLSMQLHRRFTYSQTYLEHGYKELTILPTSNGGFQMEKNALHIWPRKSFMMIALPNIDGSFTCTLFLAYENGFDQLTDESAVRAFFEREFPDFPQMAPDFVEQFFHNPLSDLATVKCFPWRVDGQALLLGDAAHAVVPFYGQGMNCSFEDCIELDAFMEQYGNDWERVFAALEKSRKPNADAIADMAVENFYEMRDHVSDPVFQRKRRLELALETQFPDRYFSKYSRVTFSTRPYAEAARIGNKQDEILMRICAAIASETELNLDETLARVEAETANLI